MANFVVNSHLHFAGNFIFTKINQFRTLQPRKAAKLYSQLLTLEN